MAKCAVHGCSEGFRTWTVSTSISEVGTLVHDHVPCRSATAIDSTILAAGNLETLLDIRYRMNTKIEAPRDSPRVPRHSHREPLIAHWASFAPVQKCASQQRASRTVAPVVDSVGISEARYGGRFGNSSE
jgi:hypothetical protein